MRIAWIIEGPFPPSSAYYQQIHLFARRLNDFGYLSSIIHLASIQEDKDEMLRSIRKFKPDVIVNFGDVQYFGLADEVGIPVIYWTIKGGGTIPPEWGQYSMVTFACLSRFTQNLFKQAGVSPAPYFPHGFDPGIFHPGRRKSARTRLGWSHTDPTVLMVGTNYPLRVGFGPPEGINDPRNYRSLDRKNLAGGLKAFAGLLKSRPKTKLYIHTNSKGVVDLPREIKKLKIEKSVMLADQSNYGGGSGWSHPASYVADLYRASNVFLFPSHGEGFGVPIIEAQACGIPVISTDWGPMTELNLTGARIKATQHPLIMDWGIPDEKEMTSALVKWIDVDKPWEISKRIQNFSAEAIIEDYLLDILKDAQNEKI